MPFVPLAQPTTPSLGLATFHYSVLFRTGPSMRDNSATLLELGSQRGSFMILRRYPQI